MQLTKNEFSMAMRKSIKKQLPVECKLLEFLKQLENTHIFKNYF